MSWGADCEAMLNYARNELLPLIMTKEQAQKVTRSSFSNSSQTFFVLFLEYCRDNGIKPPVEFFDMLHVKNFDPAYVKTIKDYSEYKNKPLKERVVIRKGPPRLSPSGKLIGRPPQESIEPEVNYEEIESGILNDPT